MLKVNEGKEEKFRVDLMMPRVMAMSEVRKGEGWRVRRSKAVLKPVYKRNSESWGLWKSVNAVRNWFLQPVE
jgi:hypothetical protein